MTSPSASPIDIVFASEAAPSASPISISFSAGPPPAVPVLHRGRHVICHLRYGPVERPREVYLVPHPVTWITSGQQQIACILPGQVMRRATTERATLDLRAVNAPALREMLDDLYGARVTVYDDVGAVRGRSLVVDQIEVDADDVRIRMSGGELGEYPLRRLGEVSSTFAAADALAPVVLGRASVRPVRLGGQRYLVADHACVSVDDVTVGGVPVLFSWTTNLDDIGRSITVVTLAQAPAEGLEVRADVRGKLGACGLRENPVDVLEELMDAAGAPIEPGQYRRVKQAYADAGIVVGAAIETRESLAELVGSLLDDLHWHTSGTGGWSELLPARQPVGDLRAETGQLSTEVVTEMVASGAGVIQVWAERNAERRYGRRAERWEPRWITSAEVLALVARARMALVARPGWMVAAQGSERVEVGDAMDVTSDSLPIDGIGIVVQVEETESGSVAMVLVRPDRATRVELVRESVLDESTATVSAGDATTERVIVVTDDQGQALRNADVWIDGRGPRRTDGGGAVSIPAAWWARGTHQIVARVGSRTVTVSVSA